MLQTALGLMVASIAIASYVRMRRDPRFTPRVIGIHIVAIAGYLIVCAISVYTILLLSEESALRGFALLASLGGFFTIAFGGVAILARYLKKILDREQNSREE